MSAGPDIVQVVYNYAGANNKIIRMREIVLYILLKLPKFTHIHYFYIHVILIFCYSTPKIADRYVTIG